MRWPAGISCGLAGAIIALAGCSSPPAATTGQAEIPPPPPATDYCAKAPVHALSCIAASDTLAVALHNTTVGLAPAVAIDTEHLSATLIPRTPGTPVVLDDLSQFVVRVHTGTVRLATATLAALVEQRFANDDAAIRRLRLSQRGDRIVLDGQFRRRGWVPFHLVGDLTRLDDTHLALTPSRMSVDGQSAMALMRAAHLALADIITLDTPAFTVHGNRIIVDITALLPAPTIDLAIKHADLDADGLRLVFDDGQRLPEILPARPADSYVLLHGGRLAIGPLHTDDPRIQLEATAPGTELALSLPGYRRQLAKGTIELMRQPARATFIARLGAYETTR
ncbi:hypothetical protein [Salinisphaera japonica]|uniref:Uncharacterized protein n=1 Tax=Salinisphaera japonica YTM-1 TaxID=1209778 RepID=A0A423PPP9_9GAMM|nr:hypothetical protein [Salinisphaera japonica]ROO27579.1 hypothetical protein SAJA_09020 [Salinisphaera japonica YTM-1]